MFYRNSWISIDLDAIHYNINKLKNLRNDKQYMAVIKANGYGNGDYMIAKEALEAGASMLAVSCLDEALSLRKNGIKSEILILGYVDPMYIDICVQNNISITNVSVNHCDELIKQQIKDLKIHLKVDTGMNRIGINNLEDLKLCLEKFLKNNFKVDGIFTHFNCSDTNIELTNLQFKKFKELVTQLSYDFKYIHCCNSDATIKLDDDFSNIVRCGIATYGLSSSNFKLKPVMSLYSKIINVKTIKANESVSYGATYTATKDEIIATIPIGYADGWLRSNQGRMVVVDGHECEIVGRVCMDQMMIKLPKYYPVNTLVELIGSQMPIERVAKENNTITYEIMTLLSDRLAKNYYKNNKLIYTFNPRLDR